MIIDGIQANIIDSVIAYESGIIWKAANRRVEAIDYGGDTDHISAKISVWGTVADIADFRTALEIATCKEMIFTKGEKPFGPAFDCEGSAEYLIIGIDDMMTTDKGVAQMAFQIAASPANLNQAYNDIEFNLANFAVQEVSRKSEEGKSIFQKEIGWDALRHGWNRPEFTISLLANSQIMGGTISWLTKLRTSSFMVSCNNSMILIDDQVEISACTSFGNLRRLGNTGMWQADFDFVRAEHADNL